VLLVQAAHRALLGAVKRQLSGMALPAFLEPVGPGLQVLDRPGLQGRPLASVAEGRTLRALDLLGDFLLVSVNRTRRSLMAT